MKIKWHSIVFDLYEEEVEERWHPHYAPYSDPITIANKAWNTREYNRIQDPGNREFESDWKAEWNKRMNLQRIGINVPFYDIPTRQHGEFLETFEPQFQSWFTENISDDDYKKSIKDKSDILLLNTKYEDWRKSKRSNYIKINSVT
jgi:hypothetical protein